MSPGAPAPRQLPASIWLHTAGKASALGGWKVGGPGVAGLIRLEKQEVWN